MRKIIHIDMDCFFAAVEMRDQPHLRHLPIAVGGAHVHRGVISTCNYLAREFGVRSAMATAHALKLCPNLVLIAGSMAKYRAVSAQLATIFSRYTTKYEFLSLDEAYLDVSDCQLFHGSATLIAQDIRQSIERELALTASAGVACVKFAAKIASDLNKPNGLCVITPAQLGEFVKTLPLEKLPGVGKVTLAKLHQFGLYVGADVQRYEKAKLKIQFGKLGEQLWHYCHGLDEREVITDRERKSVAVEVTLANDIYTKQQCLEMLKALYPQMKKRLQQVGGPRCVVRQGVKLKFVDFTQTTVERRTSQYQQNNFALLLNQVLTKQQGRGIRLIGISVGLMREELAAAKQQQLSFDFAEYNEL
ncbi:MAG: DNA polymerase IV [Vibrionaceae bacterium]